jgi:lipoprotein-anchoring transpeptidase ErfK/SrfK
MRQVKLFLSALLLCSFAYVGNSMAAPRLVAKIDLSQQRMNVFVGGKRQYSWPVSTARRGYRTPVGSFSPKVLKRMHYSKKYHNSPMPHSVFFLGGYAIHGTGAIRRLGQPASHGCVRLHPSNARRLFRLIKAYGKGNTRIKIVR